MRERKKMILAFLDKWCDFGSQSLRVQSLLHPLNYVGIIFHYYVSLGQAFFLLFCPEMPTYLLLFPDGNNNALICANFLEEFSLILCLVCLYISSLMINLKPILLYFEMWFNLSLLVKILCVKWENKINWITPGSRKDALKCLIFLRHSCANHLVCHHTKRIWWCCGLVHGKVLRKSRESDATQKAREKLLERKQPRSMR